MSSLPTRLALLLRYMCTSSKKNGNLGTCTLCSEPSPAAQHALTTMTGAYAETTFPFRISAGAMAFISPLPTMDTTKTEDPLASPARGTTQPTCLGTTPEMLLLRLRSSQPLHPPPANARAQSGKTERPDVAKSGDMEVRCRGKMKELGDEWLAEMIGWWKKPFRIASSGRAGNSRKRGQFRSQPFLGGAAGGARGAISRENGLARAGARLVPLGWLGLAKVSPRGQRAWLPRKISGQAPARRTWGSGLACRDETRRP